MAFPAFESADEANRSIYLQESDTYSLRSVGDSQEGNEEWQSESSPDSIPLMVCVFGLLPGIMITALLTIYFLSSGSLSEATMKGTQAPESPNGSMAVPSVESISPRQSHTMETPAPLSSTKAVPIPTVPPVVGTETALPTTVSAGTALPTTFSPSGAASDNVCTTDECHFMAQWLRQKLDPKADPCKDFYRFVCGTFKEGPGADAFARVNDTMTSITIGAAYAARVPATGQTSWQKAAGMFQACASLIATDRTETADLVAWMTSIDLDLKNQTALQSVDPKDMMVRCSLDFGVHAIISIKLLELVFIKEKRGLILTYSEKDSERHASARNVSEEAKLDDYVQVLSLYGLDLNETKRLASLISKHKSTLTNQKTLNETASMAENIRRAFRTAFETSSWVTGDVRQLAIQKITNMKYYLGSPGQRLDPAAIEKYYDSVPDVTTDKFFEAWRKALSVLCHQTWADQKTRIFDETTVNAYYYANLNTAVIPTAILQLPLIYTGAPPAINYGGIGAVIGHEIMHGYDVEGITFDASGTQRHWATPEFLANYTEKALCLRESHKAAKKMKARQAVLDDTLDSENLNDFVGAAIAHAAYASLPALQRNLKLPGLNLTAEHLFFVGHCAKWCENWYMRSARYAPGRSRCIVPLSNMVEFSDAFGCAPGTPMNPPKKCVFWL
ncbi:uncharacterized protein [Dermacentor albipictus]|uniref:uncharacterized protein isoform X4 n=1 Tax=Dermacentor albipictus TaxID=60249 RepID=UPI0038FC0252